MFVITIKNGNDSVYQETPLRVFVKGSTSEPTVLRAGEHAEFNASELLTLEITEVASAGGTQK